MPSVAVASSARHQQRWPLRLIKRNATSKSLLRSCYGRVCAKSILPARLRSPIDSGLISERADPTLARISTPILRRSRSPFSNAAVSVAHSHRPTRSLLRSFIKVVSPSSRFNAPSYSGRSGSMPHSLTIGEALPSPASTTSQVCLTKHAVRSQPITGVTWPRR
jgi:hypothetical protein